MRAYVSGVGLCGPGLDGWAVGGATLAGPDTWIQAETRVPAASLLAPNERRRTGLPVRLALSVSEEAVRMAGLELGDVRGVFGSGNGEAAILHELLQTLASESPRISPTQFHNSVHNAAAGYWAIGARSRQPMTCLGAGRDTFAATLMKAAAEVEAEQEPVLMCVYDVPMPEPLAAKNPTVGVYACALVLGPQPRRALAEIRVEWTPRAPATGADMPAGERLVAMSAGNPAARSLRLLQALASRRPARAEHSLSGGAVLVSCEPC